MDNHTIIITYFIAGERTNRKFPKKKLGPSDFKGVPDESSNYLARTYVRISFAYYNPVNCTTPGTVKLTCDTKAVVSEKSWMKLNRAKRFEQLEELLSHEQGHFDIQEIFAIQLKRTVLATCFNKENYKTQIDSLFRSMNRFYDSLQLRYDAETDHMRNKDMQAIWKRKIANRLEKANRSS